MKYDFLLDFKYKNGKMGRSHIIVQTNFLYVTAWLSALEEASMILDHEDAELVQIRRLL